MRYAKEERIPVLVRCDIDPKMRGFVILRHSPYMAKTNAKGEFQIKNLPVGEHVFQLWHERMGYVRNISIGERKTDRRGKLEVKIRPGANRLPTIELDAHLLPPESPPVKIAPRPGKTSDES